MDTGIIDLLRQPSKDSEVNNQLLNYVENLAQHVGSLSLCFDVLNDYKNPNDQYAKFVALQILEKQMTYFPDVKISSQASLFGLLGRYCSNEVFVQSFVLNKLIQLISTLFLELYATHWQDFFTNWQSILSFGVKGVHCYLKLMEYINDEINRSTGKNTEMENIKTKLKETYISQFVESTFKIIEFYSNTEPEPVIYSINTLSKYASWIDINFTYNQNLFSLILTLVHNPVYQDSICQYIYSLVEKGLNRNQKLSLINDLLAKLTNVNFFNSPYISKINMGKIISKAGTEVIECLIVIHKEKNSLVSEHFQTLNKIAELAMMILQDDNEEIFSTVLQFTSKFFLFSKAFKSFTLSHVESLFQLIWNKCRSYFQFTQEDIDKSVDVNKSLRSVLISANIYFQDSEECFVLKLIIDDMRNLSAQTLVSVKSLLILTTELPQIASILVLKLPTNQKLLSDLIELILQNIVNTCVDPEVAILALTALVRFDFLFSNDLLKYPIIDVFLSDYSINSLNKEVSNKSIALFSKFISSQLSKISEQVNERIFNFFYQIISSQLNPSIFNSEKLSSQHFEILCLVLMNSTLVEEKKIAFLNECLFEPLIQITNHIFTQIQKSSLLLMPRGSKSQPISYSPVLVQLNDTLNFLLSSLKVFKSYEQVTQLGAVSLIETVNNVFTNLMLYFYKYEEIKMTIMDCLIKTASCLSHTSFPPIVAMFNQLKSAKESLVDYLPFFIFVFSKLKTVDPLVLKDLFVLIFYPLVESVLTQDTSIMITPELKILRRDAVQFFKVLLERNLLSAYSQEDNSISLACIRSLANIVVISDDNCLSCEALNSLGFISAHIRAGSVIVPPNDIQFYEINFIHPSMRLLSICKNLQSNAILKKVLSASCKIFCNLPPDIVIASIQRVNSQEPTFENCNDFIHCLKNNNSFTALFKELTKILTVGCK